jgi:hypothetical protein
LGLHLKSTLYRIPVYSGFGLDRIWFRQDLVYSGFGLDRIWFRQDLVYSGFGLVLMESLLIEGGWAGGV